MAKRTKSNLETGIIPAPAIAVAASESTSTLPVSGTQQPLETAFDGPPIKVSEISAVIAPPPPLRNPDGTFVKGQSGNIAGSPSARVAKWFRQQLEGMDPADPHGRSRLEGLFQNMMEIAMNQDRTTRKEAIWAFDAMMNRAYGPPQKGQEELDAIAKGGQIFVIVKPTTLDDIPTLKALPDSKPEFEDAEFEDIDP